MAVDAATPGQLSESNGDSGETSAAPDDYVVTGPDVVFDYDETSDDITGGAGASTRRSPSPLLLGLLLGLVTIMSLGALAGWLGMQARHAEQATAERDLYLQAARQGAVNITTIDYQHADADIQRILDSATGEFHDEFAERSKPLVDAVNKAQSTSQGTVTEAGLESLSGSEAQAIVVVSVQTASPGGPEQPPRSWRMRLTVQKSGDDVKVSKVGFVQ